MSLIQVNSITAYTGNIVTVFSNLNLQSVSAGTSVNNLGIDASGNVIIGSTGGNGGSSPISVVNSSSLFSTALPNTGLNASGVTNSIFMGINAGYLASGASTSIFMGGGAGLRATNASNSIFLGSGAGVDAYYANNSIFFGQNTGLGATNAINSNFFGYQAGQAAPNASYSNFLGYYAGDNASNASYSNFFGTSAGENASGAYQSNFIGSSAGKEANNAFYSNFFGNSAGFQATNANDSNFMGQQAGYQATGALRSNFMGNGAGNRATAASYSNLFGYLVGKTFGSNNIGTNNIIIGTNISLPNATTNSINIGGVLFGTGAYSSIVGNPSISANTSGKIGIGIVTPTEKLHVSGNTLVEGNIIINSLKNATSLATDSNGKIISSTGSTNGTEVFVTGGTYTNGTATFTNNTGGTFTVTGFKTSDVFVNSASYNGTTGVLTLTNTTGGTITATGFSLGGGGGTDNYWISGSTGTASVAQKNTLSNATGNYSVAMGYKSLASGGGGHAEGGAPSFNYSGGTASGEGSHAEGVKTLANYFAAHAEGDSTISSGSASHAEGWLSIASGQTAHAEGYQTIAGGFQSHAEGYSTQALGDSSHTEGNGTIASGTNGHAEGSNTRASGANAHTEGDGTIASGNNSHAGGAGTVASGITSFVHGLFSNALGQSTIVLGDNITGTAAKTVYVNNLVIDNLKSASTGLQTDANGKVIALPSDERLKHNITDLSDSLTKVNNLRGVSFEFNEEVNILGTKLGFIAQEVNNVIPELVNLLPNTEDMLTVDYIGMIPVLVEAIKELTKQNLELKARLDNANL